MHVTPASTIAPGRARRRLPRWTWGGAVALVGWTGVVAGAGALLVRWRGFGWQPLIVLASFTPLLLIAPVVGAALLAVRRRWIGVAVALVVVAGGVVVEAPLFVAAHRPTGGVALSLLQANLRVGAADADKLVARIGTEHVDLVTVEELTSAELTSLKAAGIDALLPFHLVTPYPGGAGTGIWSRYPLSAPVKHDEFRFEVLSATAALPGAVPLHLYAVHLLPPWPYPSGTWSAEMTHLSALLNATATGTALVVSGDFNATLDHAQFRHLLRRGLRDAAEQVGDGFFSTYPTDRKFPPLLTLDHVLCRGLSPTSLTRVPIPGSDHRGLLVHLAVPTA